MRLIAPGRQLARGENLVDPSAVEIYHFETPAVLSKCFADFRYPLHPIEYETGGGMKVPAFGQSDMQRVGEFLNGSVAGDEKRSVVARNNVFFRGTFFGTERADDRFENVGRGHQALEMTIFIMDESNMHRSIFENPDGIQCIHGLGNYRSRGDEFAGIKLAAAHIGIEQILGLDDADNHI